MCDMLVPWTITDDGGCVRDPCGCWYWRDDVDVEIKRLREENKRLTIKASCVLRETEARAERDAKIEVLEEVLDHPNFMRINNTSAYGIIGSMLVELKAEGGA